MTGQTVIFKNPIYILDTASMGGPKEKDGPIGKYLDKTFEDDILGQKSHELAETKFHHLTLKYLLNKTHLKTSDIDISLMGDLSDEIYCSNFAMRELDIPFIGIYNACATYGAALITGALHIESGLMDNIICSTSSHFSAAERQYRFPLELGNQRTPLSQWTVTGCGATLLNRRFGKVKVESATVGKVIDFGIKDANNMGAAMAPAAMDTIVNHLKDTRRSVDYYDLIVTGDLGEAGSRVLRHLMEEEGFPFKDNYQDCGALIYNRMAQKVEQGGSGAGCSSVVFNSYIYKKMLEGVYKKVLLVPTGALISKVSGLQSQTIPSIAHAVSFELTI